MICKNCQEQTIANGKYCHNCGQKTDTHRLTLKHFVMHDVVHGALHLDKGLPKTLREIFKRPGGVAMDYIFGKRKRYYNFFYLLLLIIGLYLFLKSCTDTPTEIKKIVEDNKMDFTSFFRKYRKAVIFSWIPILTISAAIIFRRLKLSIIELAIPATIAVIGSNFFNLLLTAANQFLPAQSSLEIFIDILLAFLSLSVFLFPLFTFISFIKNYYSLLGKIWRLIAFYLLCIILSAISLFTLMVIFSDGKATYLTFG